MKVLNVVGARPNFMKMAPILRRMDENPLFDVRLVHTGQHYGNNMSDAFFSDLGIQSPDVFLNIGSLSHAQQTAAIMSAFEPVVLHERPDIVLVVGDVNSTLACALVASKLNIKIAHVEAGLRSRDRRMPEEINRILTDHMSDMLFTTSEDADENLVSEGVSREKIFFVGNVMIDTLLYSLKQIESWPKHISVDGLEQYGVVTLHRPANVDDPAMLLHWIKILNHVSHRIPLIFPLHPRTEKSIQDNKLSDFLSDRVILIPPQGYKEFLNLMRRARLVLTDSGGLQEESSALGIPCLTLRENTERPVTVTMGTNRVVGTDASAILDAVDEILSAKSYISASIPYWDGKAADRIVTILEKSMLS